MALPLGNKKKYHSVLENAYGGKIGGDANSNVIQEENFEQGESRAKKISSPV